MDEVSQLELEILLHSLGLNHEDVREPYRNYFVAGDGHSDMPLLKSLCDKGLMRREDRTPGFLEASDGLFLVTDAGRTYALANRPKPKTLSRARRRYSAFLDMKECYPDLTFREFLTEPYFEKDRT